MVPQISEASLTLFKRKDLLFVVVRGNRPGQGRNILYYYYIVYYFYIISYIFLLSTMLIIVVYH